MYRFSSRVEILHIREDLHTGNLVEASQELLGTSFHVAERLEELVGQSGVFKDSDIQNGSIVVLRPSLLPKKVLRRWGENENWVGRFLHTTKIVNTPERTDKRLDGEMQQALTPQLPEEVEHFLDAAKKRLSYLQEDRALQRLGSLRLCALTYTESRVLRRALYQGIYLVPAVYQPNLN